MWKDLDRVESLAPGSGLVEFGLFGRGTPSGGQAGGFLDAQARLNRSLALFAHGEAGYDWSDETLYWSALGGVRLRL